MFRVRIRAWVRVSRGIAEGMVWRCLQVLNSLSVDHPFQKILFVIDKFL